MNTQRVELVTLPTLLRTSPSPLTNNRTAGTAGTVWALYLVRPSWLSHLVHLPTVVCSEQLVHSRTTGNDLEVATSSCFRLTTLALDTDRYLQPAPAPWWHVKKPPPTELQIPATITALRKITGLTSCSVRIRYRAALHADISLLIIV